MYWYSDDRSVQFNFNKQKSGLSKAFYGHRSSSVFLTNILKYRLDRQLNVRMSKASSNKQHYYHFYESPLFKTYGVGFLIV